MNHSEQEFLRALQKNENQKKLEALSTEKLCDNCLGRQFGMIGHGMTNAQRGKLLRKSMRINLVQKIRKPQTCELCKNFFTSQIKNIAKNVVGKFHGYEFSTVLVGSKLPAEWERSQDNLWEKIGIEDVEPIKSEVNREVGKLVEKLSKKKFNPKDPDVTVTADLSTNSVRLQIRSLFIYGKYQKLVRGVPQTKWICSDCGGKGCKTCKGTGKLYKTSVQEIIEKPLLKAAKSSRSSFHGGGREDIDARNLAWRPFVIEIEKPHKRKIDLKKIAKRVNKSPKVKVKGLRFVDKSVVRKIKLEKIDKTYEAVVEFENEIDKKLLPRLKTLVGVISQKTPRRVMHRRADLLRMRRVKNISYRILGKKILKIKIHTESGLYVKELISGDEGRTKQNVAEFLDNKVKKISLDVVKIHTK